MPTDGGTRPALSAIASSIQCFLLYSAGTGLYRLISCWRIHGESDSVRRLHPVRRWQRVPRRAQARRLRFRLAPKIVKGRARTIRTAETRGLEPIKQSFPHVECVRREGFNNDTSFPFFDLGPIVGSVSMNKTLPVSILVYNILLGVL